MGLYALGKDAAIAQLLGEVAGYVKTLPDGSLQLEAERLRLRSGALADEIIAQDVLAEDRPAAQAVALGYEKTSYIPPNALANAYAKTYWQSDSRWPKQGALASSSSYLSTLLGILVNANNLGNALDAHYANPEVSIRDGIEQLSTELNLTDRIPATVERKLTRVYYIYTYVTDWDEESAPSPPSEGLDVGQDDEVDISIGPPPPGRYINRWRFYATATGSTDTSFLFLAEGPIETTTGTTNPKALLGEVCPSITWLEPSPKMRGMTALPNGVLAGYHDNVLCFSEPFVPYAWPGEYQLTVSHPIVALGAFGQTLVAAHYAGIDYVSGADSASMSAQQDISKQACASPRSMVSSDMGVIYASQDGVCVASNAGVQIISLKHFSREDWQALNPNTMVGAYHESTYYFFGDFGHAYSLHLSTGKLTRLDTIGAVSAVYQDPLTDGLYFCTGTNIHQLFAGPARLDGLWRSKKVVLPGQQPLAWLSVEGDFAAPVTVRWFGDDELRHEVVLTQRGPVRLPPGRYLEHEVEIVSQGTLSAVTLASTTQELQQA